MNDDLPTIPPQSCPERDPADIASEYLAHFPDAVEAVREVLTAHLRTLANDFMRAQEDGDRLGAEQTRHAFDRWQDAGDRAVELLEGLEDL
jgi:hypothetical protein